MSDGNTVTATEVAPADVDLDTFAETFFGGNKQETEPEVHNEDDIVDADEGVANDVDTDTDEADDASDESHEGDEPDDGRPEDKPKKRRSAQERIDELTAQRYEAERRELETLRSLEALKAEVAQLRTPKQETKTETAPADAGPDPESKNEDGTAKYPLGDFDPSYIRDLTRYTIKQEQTAADVYRKEAEAIAAQEATRNAAQAAFTEKFTEVEKEIPDLRTKVMRLDPFIASIEPAYGQFLVDVVRTLDAGPRVLAYLSDNPETARSIVNSGAAAATVALGRLDAQLSKPKSVEQKKVTKAPEPPVRVRGTGSNLATSPDTDDLDAFSKAFFKPKKRGT